MLFGVALSLSVPLLLFLSRELGAGIGTDLIVQKSIHEQIPRAQSFLNNSKLAET